jgi:hypothetical protein
VSDHPLLNALRNLKTVKSLGLTVPPGLLGCCARAANGHAAAPPSSVMNSRRLTASPSLLETAPYHMVVVG